jgi:hypothetical protein
MKVVEEVRRTFNFKTGTHDRVNVTVTPVHLRHATSSAEELPWLPVLSPQLLQTMTFGG